jgi:hypothetical protein
MKVFAILAGLAVGSPAVAQPYQPSRPDYDQRIDESSRRDRGAPFDVSGEVLANTTWQRLPIPEQNIRRLRFEGTRGRTYIGLIIVNYSDGRSESYRVQRSLSGPGDSFDVPLRSGEWRYVTRVQVYTPYARPSAYRVLAEE